MKLLIKIKSLLPQLILAILLVKFCFVLLEGILLLDLHKVRFLLIYILIMTKVSRQNTLDKTRRTQTPGTKLNHPRAKI